MSQKKPIFLSGVCQSDPDRLELSELKSDEMLLKNKKYNRFIGSRNGDKISGLWYSYDDKHQYIFEATRVRPDRREVLKGAKGQYKLTDISGFYGANTMTEIFRKNGVWRASGSEISGGMRTGFESLLSQNDRTLLSSFKLIVDETLGLRIYVKGVVVADLPFTDTPLFSFARTSKDQDETSRIEMYANADSFIGDKLHVATTDQITFTEYLPFENTPISGEHVISVDYDPITHLFTIQVIDRRCCGSTSLSFLRE